MAATHKINTSITKIASSALTTTVGPEIIVWLHERKPLKFFQRKHFQNHEILSLQNFNLFHSTVQIRNVSVQQWVFYTSNVCNGVCGFLGNIFAISFCFITMLVVCTRGHPISLSMWIQISLNIRRWLRQIYNKHHSLSDNIPNFIIHYSFIQLYNSFFYSKIFVR